MGKLGYEFWVLGYGNDYGKNEGKATAGVTRRHKGYKERQRRTANGNDFEPQRRRGRRERLRKPLRQRQRQSTAKTQRTQGRLRQTNKSGSRQRRKMWNVESRMWRMVTATTNCNSKRRAGRPRSREQLRQRQKRQLRIKNL